MEEQPPLDFSAPDSSSPFQGKTAQSRHASYTGARSAVRTWGQKQSAYLQLLANADALTDQEAAGLLHWPLSSVNSIRNSLGDRVYPDGFDSQVCGSKTTRRTRWRLAR